MKNYRGLKAVCGLSVLLLLLLLLLLIFADKRFWKKKPDMPYGETTEETQTEIETETETEAEAEAFYPPPEYPFVTDEVTVPIEGVTREYTIAWVSDLHLVSDHEAGEAKGDVHVEYLDAIQKRYEELAVTPDGVHAEELWPEIIKYLNYNELDGVIFGGDIMDYCSNSNVAMVKEGLDSLKIPYIYVRADHDYGLYYGGIFFTDADARALHQTIDGDETGNKFWDRNEFMVLGIDNSTKDMPEYYYNMVADVYARNRPVIMATHVPYDPRLDGDKASLAALSMQVRGTIYYWSEASDHYRPNETTGKYLDMIYSEDTVVGQVLAGHLHSGWDGKLTQKVPQHIFAPAFSGSIGIIHIVPGR